VTASPREERAAEPVRLELVGRPGDLAMPDVCACCGAQATERVERAAAFERWTEDETPAFSHWAIFRMRLPVCAACAARHREEERPVAARVKVVSLLHTWFSVGLVGGALLAACFAAQAARRAALGDCPGVTLFGLMAGVFALLALGHLVAAVRRRRGEWPTPETSVTACLAFGDDASELFEAERHVYRVAGARFEAAFREANVARLWDPSGPRAPRAERWRLVAAAAIGLLGVLVVVLGLLRGR
jgi:hypothetical protein